MPSPEKIKSGFVAIVGRPNAGKSTLLNRLVGTKVSIVTQVPQTTRNRILGVVHRPGAQIVLIDTPGIHKPLSRMNEQMMQFVRQALEDLDLALLIVDASVSFGHGDQFAVDLIKRYGPKTFLLLNKIDLIRKSRLLPLMDRYRQLHEFAEIFPISALDGSAVEEMLEAIVRELPEGPAYYPADMVTDQPERFLAGEIIREKLIQETRQELPFVTAVLVDELDQDERRTLIRATILVERDSQKPIVIGAGGALLKQIGTAARLELERRFPPKVFLELFVKVAPGWRDDRAMVRALDYRSEGSE